MDRRTDAPFFDLLTQSYRRFLGEELVPAGMSGPEGARWLYESAPFLLLAHDTAADPLFIYGNKTAQRRFEYEWDELVGLPSRLSAAAPDRNERSNFIERVTKDGYARNYRGIRIAKSGKQFWIEQASLWQLVADDGMRHGLAAMIPTTADLK
ncbi:MEKHLA domain-containing protein [Trinickia symbiotica]|uniref:MEKHLA domain-containing protein n=1 Tax=Trinickia symbiotica TaxID=863227 RepID=A0A2T3Y1C3_9BURK|nr:MEKHLA domain-containing protein [Trinickia symbiotica]PTB22570.1 MEKHLA domain-containing protein [Trinickia symbiotica]